MSCLLGRMLVPALRIQPMSTATEELLARLAGKNTDPGSDLYTAMAASKPKHEDEAGDAKLNNLLQRINDMTGGAVKTAPTAEPPPPPTTEFIPLEPSSIAAAALTESEVSGLALKFLLSRGDATGRDIADQVKLPFVLIDEL